MVVAAIPWLGTIAFAQLVEAHIKSVKGSAVRYNKNTAFTLARGDVLAPGDEIDTRADGRVVIELTDGSVVTVQPNTQIVINNYRTTNSWRDLFKVVLGKVRVKIHHYVGKPNPYRVNSPTASILVRGTEFGVLVEPTGETRVVVYEGLVEVLSLSDPRRRALVPPGGGVLVRFNEDLRFFTPGPGSEISDRNNAQNGAGLRRNLLADQNANAGISASSSIRAFLASDYERYIDSIVEPGQSPLFSRFLAVPDSHFDSLSNPAYSTEFNSMEGRLWLLPSLSARRGSGTGFDVSNVSPLNPQDAGVLMQGTMFMPMDGGRMIIGGALSLSGSRLQSLTETSVISPPIPFYPEGVLGLRRAGSSTETTSISGTVMAARRFGVEGRTSLGVSVDYLSGGGALRGQTSLQNNAGLNAVETLEAGSDINRTRIETGLTHQFRNGHKLGLFYRHGMADAEDRDRSRLFNGLPLSLDRVSYESRSSEVGLRLRGTLTRRLYYGLEGSWINVGIDEKIRRAVIVDASAQESISRAAIGAGIAFSPWKRAIISADFNVGKSRVREKYYEDETGNLLQDVRQQIFFLSSHVGFQTDVWRQFFVNASLLGIRQSSRVDLNLFPDRFERRLTSFGLIEANGRTLTGQLSSLSDFGAGWRFNPTLLAEYIYSVNRDLGPPRHIFLLRYTFKREK
jgi:hypothetical protein